MSNDDNKFDLDAWLEWLQQPGPKVIFNGKPMPYVPMTKAKADLIKATFEHKELQTTEMKLGLALMDGIKTEE